MKIIFLPALALLMAVGCTTTPARAAGCLNGAAVAESLDILPAITIGAAWTDQSRWRRQRPSIPGHLSADRPARTWRRRRVVSGAAQPPRSVSIRPPCVPRPAARAAFDGVRCEWSSATGSSKHGFPPKIRLVDSPKTGDIALPMPPGRPNGWRSMPGWRGAGSSSRWGAIQRSVPRSRAINSSINDSGPRPCRIKHQCPGAPDKTPV